MIYLSCWPCTTWFPSYFHNTSKGTTFKSSIKKLCPLAYSIRVPSQKTKEDLINILNIKPDKIFVIQHGAPNIAVSSSKPIRWIDRPYILFLGERAGYKNFKLLLKELEIIVQFIPELVLLCTGHPFNNDEQRILADLHLTENVHQIFANDNNFYSLYHYAVAFVYPSAYEGFGLPILESFVCEWPLFLNNTSCFPEVGGDAVMHFDINRKVELAEQFFYIYNAHNVTWKKLINRGKDISKNE